MYEPWRRLEDPVTVGFSANLGRWLRRGDAADQGIVALAAIARVRVKRPARGVTCFLGAGAARENRRQCDGKQNGGEQVVTQHPIRSGRIILGSVMKPALIALLGLSACAGSPRPESR